MVIHCTAGPAHRGDFKLNLWPLFESFKFFNRLFFFPFASHAHKRHVRGNDYVEKRARSAFFQFRIENEIPTHTHTAQRIKRTHCAHPALGLGTKNKKKSKFIQLNRCCKHSPCIHELFERKGQMSNVQKREWREEDEEEAERRNGCQFVKNLSVSCYFIII